ncbi:MBL fold metallo-hydrolase [Flexivirga alba]|uniref:MBL fold metallo-hydrolase n=1 Tax=Flexivirga alba TaxID=702742 RepID=A0ABW2AH18_9MICO
MKLRQVTTDVFLVEGTASNWVLIRDGQDLTLIDAGYPKDVDGLVASVQQLGHRIEDIRGVLITHAHIDHVGAIPALLQRHQVPTYADEHELPMLRGERHEQANTWDVVSRCWRPRVAKWAITIARAGARTDIRLPETQSLQANSPLDLPGAPRAVPCPGHTSGHTAYVLADAGIVVTGDALITAHPIVARSGPQQLPAFFSHAPAQTDAGLDALARLDVDTVLPGHGPVWRGSIKAAVDKAHDSVSTDFSQGAL